MDEGMTTSRPWEARTANLLGEDALRRLAQARVLVVGIGGVGGYAAEILCRSSVGALTLVDADSVAESNINRQIIATQATVGQSKAILFAERFHIINPDASINAVNTFLTPDSVADLLAPGYDYVIDAIDTVAPKTALIAHCLLNNIPIISSMGAGGRIDPTQVRYADLWETREDGLARAVRQRLKKGGIKRSLKVVCSTEAPRSHALIHLDERNKRSSFGTLASIPAIFGIYLANYVIRKIAKV